jgi:hypothetical protein
MCDSNLTDNISETITSVKTEVFEKMEKWSDKLYVNINIKNSYINIK